MKYVLTNTEGFMVSKVDAVNEKVSFTKDRHKAKGYNNIWYGDNELQWLKFHMGNKYPKLHTMSCKYI